MIFSNMLNASTNTANAFADLINGYEFLELASDAIIAAAPRTDSYGCMSPYTESIISEAD